MLKLSFKTAKTSSTSLLKSVATRWGDGSKLLSPAKTFKMTKISS